MVKMEKEHEKLKCFSINIRFYINKIMSGLSDNVSHFHQILNQYSMLTQ